jgi:hypothetical protein
VTGPKPAEEPDDETCGQNRHGQQKNKCLELKDDDDDYEGLVAETNYGPRYDDDSGYDTDDDRRDDDHDRGGGHDRDDD